MSPRCKDIKERALEILREHPYAVGIVGTGVFSMVAPTAVASPVLTIVGFGAEGVKGGSIAAFVQSCIGPVGLNSAFAWLQSVGATGLIPPAVQWIISTFGFAAMVEGVRGIVKWQWRRKEGGALRGGELGTDGDVGVEVGELEFKEEDGLENEGPGKEEELVKGDEPVEEQEPVQEEKPVKEEEPAKEEEPVKEDKPAPKQRKPVQKPMFKSKL